jgi:hypothetical protein
MQAQKASLPNAANPVASTSCGAGQRDQLEKAATFSLPKGPSRWSGGRDGRAHRQLPPLHGDIGVGLMV